MKCSSTIFLILFLASVVYGEDQWYSLYALGRQAAESKNWSDVETYMKRAMKLQQPGRNVREYGTQFMPVYVPDFYLGLSYFNQNRYQEALQLFNEVKSRGILRATDPEYSMMADAIEVINSMNQEAQASKESPDTEKKLQASTFEEFITEAKNAISAKRMEEARHYLNMAKDLKPNAPEVEELQRAIDASELIKLCQDAIRKPDLQEGDRLLIRLISLDPHNPKISELKLLLARMKNEANTDKTMLSNGIKAYYAGRYQDASSLLLNFLKKNKSPKAFFYLGCSQAAIALLNKPKDRNDMLQKARESFHHSLQLDPSFPYDSLYVSPRILKVFHESYQ